MQKEKLALLKAERLLKKKTILLSLWDCERKTSWTYQNGYLPLKKIFRNIILFDPRKNRIKYGSELMKKKLFDILKEKKPDYFLFLIEANDLGIDTIMKINKISPQTKTIVHFGDDDIHFATRSRYYALFVDYCLIGLGQYVFAYKKDKLFNIFPLTDTINTEHFKPLNIEKKYDVTFVGSAYPSLRVDLIRFLIKNNLNVRIWGRGWGDYPEFKNIYGGIVDLDEYVKIINQTKVNLAPSRGIHGKPHLTGRVFEVAACKAFSLCDYHSEFLKHLGRDYEPAMFRDNNELLRKINYFLNNKKEREKISLETYKRVIKNHDMANKLRNFFIKTLKEKNNLSRKLPNVKRKIIMFKKKELKDNINILKKKLKDISYICFLDEKCKIHTHRNYLLAHALEKTKKNISCCGYSVFSRKFGRYLTFGPYVSYKALKYKDFNKLININQIMVKKSYFLKNLDKFRDFLNGGKIDIIQEDNTAFIEIPLIEIEGLNRINKRGINKLEFELLEKSYQFNFMIRLQSLLRNKKVFYDSYIYNLIFHSLINKEFFIVKYLFNRIYNKGNLASIFKIKF